MSRSEVGVACLRAMASQLPSSRNPDSPDRRGKSAGMRASITSIVVTVTESAGTKLPMCARYTISPIYTENEYNQCYIHDLLV